MTKRDGILKLSGSARGGAKKSPTQIERQRKAQARPLIVKEIERLEREYGEATVSGAYNRHRAIRAARRKLAEQRQAIDAKIAKLKS